MRRGQFWRCPICGHDFMFAGSQARHTAIELETYREVGREYRRRKALEGSKVQLELNADELRLVCLSVNLYGSHWRNLARDLAAPDSAETRAGWNAAADKAEILSAKLYAFEREQLANGAK